MPDPAIDVPDDFDLNDALNATSSTDNDQRDACPDCGSFQVVRKTQKRQGGGKRKAGAWRCRNCRSHFDQPAQGGSDG